MTYTFKFEKSPKKKGVCPECGQQNKFRYYEDAAGNRLPESFGKCERTNSCGYHAIPTNEYNTLITKDLVSQSAEIQVFIKPPSFWIKKFSNWATDLSSNFHQYCRTLGITDEHLVTHGVATDDKSKKTVFLFRNYEGHIVNAKWFLYADSGKRIATVDSHSLKQPSGKSKYELCLFGEDLLDKAKDKTVVLVESEKSKVIASFFYPEYDWVACGSNNGLTSEKVAKLFGRKVIWLCDADKAGRTNSSIKKLKEFEVKYEVVDLYPDREDGFDIADAIGMGLKPKLETPPSQKVANKLETPTVQYRDDNSIWVKTRNNWEEVADNFQIFIKYLTEDLEGKFVWILEIKIRNREDIFLEVSNDDFSSAKKMRSILLTQTLGLKATDVHFIEIQSLLFKTEFNKALKMIRLGFHEDSKAYFFSNVVLNRHGELIEPDQFRIIKSDNLYLSMPVANSKLKKRFLLTENEISFNAWFKMYDQSHSQDKIFIPTCHYIMSLFRDVVVNHKGSSPILYLKGVAGSGKTSIMRDLTCLFGFAPSPINLKSKNTEAALVKLMSQAANSLIWMDEFHNDFGYEGILQAAYDNAGYHKTPESSKNNTDTDSVEIHSALALTSNYIPDNRIFFSRCVLVQIDKTEMTSEQKAAFSKLLSIETKGLATISVELLRHRSLIEEQYANTFKLLDKRLVERFGNEEIPERLLSNILQTITCACVLQLNKKISICESVDEEDILDEFMDIAVSSVRKQYAIQTESSALAEFFTVLQTLYETLQIHEGVHFRFDSEYLHLRMPSIYPIFKQKYRAIYFKESPDKDTIVQEILKMENPRQAKDIIKTIRFRGIENEGDISMKNAVSNSLSIVYLKYVNMFSLDLENRRH